MTSITIQIAPNLKNAENFSNSSILSDLNVIMKNKGFNDILDHGRFIFNDVIKPLEEDCKKRNIPPLVFTVTVSDALALAIESISQYSQLSCSTVAKIIVYRSNELRQMKDSKASSSHYEKPRSLANTDVKNKDYLINGEQRQQDSTRNNFSRAKHSERQIKQDKQYNQIQRGQAKKQEQNTSNNQMQNFNHHISKDQNTYTEPKEVVVVDGWGEPVEKSLDHLQPKLSVQNKNKSIDRHAYDEWGIPLNPEVTLEKLPSHKREIESDGMVSPDEDEERKLFSKSQEMGINFRNYNDIPVVLTGNNIPKCIESFDEAKLKPSIMNSLRLSRYDFPTPIQKHAIPIILSGRDIKASAQTGSGKTAAFLIPLIHEIISHLEKNPEKDADEVCPYALILSPTRELCIQTYEEALKFSYRSKVRTQLLYGGAGNKELEKCEILVATPGRLIDFVLKRKTVNFSRLKYFVLDEADKMLDLGFHPQIRQLELRMPEREDRQTLLFSATFPPEMDFLKKDQVGIAVGRIGSTSNSITQSLLYFRDQNEKMNAIIKLVNEFQGPTVVFVNMKVICNLLAQLIQQETRAKVTTIHGDLEQYQREEALDKFREGKARVLIATDVFSRGIDISSIQHVIIFDMPNSIDDYVHRIGRTGRAGKEGRSTAFLTTENSRIAPELVEVLVESKQEVPNWLNQLVKKENAFRAKAKDRRNEERDDYDYPVESHRRKNARNQKFGSIDDSSFDSEENIEWKGGRGRGGRGRGGRGR